MTHQVWRIASRHEDLRTRNPAGLERLLAVACAGFVGLIAVACAPLEVTPEPIEHPMAPLSVDAAVMLALRNHPDVRIARQRLLQAASDVDEYESMLWPDVSVGASFARTNTPSQVFGQLLDQGEFSSGIDFNDPGTRSNFRAEIGGSVTLYDGGRRQARLSRAEAHLGAKVAIEEEVRSLIAFETASAWYRVHATRAAAAVARRETPVLEELIETTEAERESGAALPLAIQELQVQLSNARHSVQLAEAAALRARATLANLLGLGVEEIVELQAPEALEEGVLQPLEESLERARRARPELVRAHQEVEAALAGLRESEAGYLPELGVSGVFGSADEHLRLSNPSWMLGIGLVKGLTESLRTPHRVRRAAAELLVAHESGRRSLLAVEGEVVAAWLDAQEAESVLALARQTRVRAEATLHRIEAEREVGVARAVTLSRARLAADRAATQDQIDTLRCAQARIALAHAVGTFPVRSIESDEEKP